MAVKFGNLKIGTKLVMGFIIVILCTVIIGTVGLLALQHVNKEYKDLLEQAVVLDESVTQTELLFLEMRRASLHMGYAAGTREEINEYYGKAMEALAAIKLQREEINLLLRIESKNFDEQDRIETIQSVNAIFDLIEQDYTEVIDSLYSAVLRDDKESENFIAVGSSIASDITSELKAFSDQLQEYKDYTIARVGKDVSDTIFLQGIIMAAVIIISIAIAFIITYFIRTPIESLTESAKKIAGGDLQAFVRSNARDEIGALSNSMADMAEIFLQLTEEINGSYRRLARGDLDAYVNEDLFDGDYREAAISVNMNQNYLIDVVNDIRACLKAYAKGDFSQNLRQLPGDQAIANDTMNYLRNNLMHVEEDIRMLIDSAQKGDLSVQIQEDLYEGDWKKVTAGLNGLVRTIEVPVTEVAAVLDKMALGDFSVQVEGNYEGRFKEMEQSVNKMVDKMNVYIRDISNILVKMSNKDLDIEQTEEYIGDFKVIQEALRHIVGTFNMLLSDFNSSAEQVAESANQISRSSMTLAQGATEQSSSLEEVFQALAAMKTQTKLNAKNAANANQLSADTRQQSEENKEKMSKLLVFMEKILADSSAIASIINAIDDIALQTNLLALNAAVEASRAGSHGKGFSVVADEVRNLANKSQTLASETSGLIQQTINRMRDGTALAGETWTSLNIMIEQMTQVGDLVSKISHSCAEHHETINTVTENYNNIHQIITANMSMSQQYASSSEELYNQADLFKANLSQFKLSEMESEHKDKLVRAG